jgi:hypothetical protein
LHVGKRVQLCAGDRVAVPTAPGDDDQQRDRLWDDRRRGLHAASTTLSCNELAERCLFCKPAGRPLTMGPKPVRKLNAVFQKQLF